MMMYGENHGLISLKCDFCGAIFSSSISWGKHIDLELSNLRYRTVLTCKRCDYATKSIRNLSLHIKRRICRDSTVPKDRCRYCKGLFTNYPSMKQHVKNNRCLSSNKTDQAILKFIIDTPQEPLFTPRLALKLDYEFKQMDGL